MSFQSWHNYGYGICTDDIKEHSVSRLEALLSAAPIFKCKVQDQLSREAITNPQWDDYMAYDTDYELGLATILGEVIGEAEGIALTACDNYDGQAYLLYPPKYPWELTDAERGLTKERVEEIFQYYVGILTDDPIPVDAQAVENGG